MFHNSATSTNYVGYGSVAHSVIDARRHQRHLIIKVVSVISVIIFALFTFGFGGYKAIDFIQGNQNKFVQATPVQEYSGQSSDNMPAQQDDTAVLQKGTVSRVQKKEPTAAATARTSAPVAGTSVAAASIACTEYPKFPDQTCTGVPKGTSLTPLGPTTITQNDTVIDGNDITGGIIIRANNVTIKNSIIRGSGSGNGITVVSGTAKVTDTEITNFENGIIGDNWRAYRLNIHNMTTSGVTIGSYAIFEDSWVHGFKATASSQATGIRIANGIVSATVRHNSVDLSTETNIHASIAVVPTLGPNSKGPLLIEKNLLGGGDYTLYCTDGASGNFIIQNITISLNHFVRSVNLGPSKVTVPVTQSQNTWHDNGQALSL